MELVGLKLSKLSETEKYHVYVPDAHTYYAARYNVKNKVFKTIPNYDSPMEPLRPETISALGVELIKNEDIYKKAATVYKVVEG